MEIVFKASDIADENALFELREEFQLIEPFPNPLDATTNHAVLRQLFEDERFGKIWLIMCDGATAGYIVLTFGDSLEYAGRDALIDELYLREAFRGRGIGGAAIKFVEDYCRAINIKAVHLEVEHENTAAQNLYRKIGFVNHDRYFLTKWI